jgi:translation initiation factor IF-2
MLPRKLRVGNLVDDYCPRERRLSNHAIVALVGDEVRQVRCTTCDAEHEYRQGKVPSSRKKKPALADPPLAPARSAPDGAASSEPADPPPDETAGAASSPAGVPAAAHSAPAQKVEATVEDAAPAHADIAFHRRLIRATLPRVEGDVPARPIPEFTMHRPAPAGHGPRHGKPFRPGQGGGLHRPGGGGKSGFGAGRPGGPRHGQGQGEPNGNTFGHRSGQGQRGASGGPAGHGSPHGPRPPRHGFGGGKPLRGPKKH